ncbi:bifunctional demethylmenaquinone methyltransferase/2-methoxy-6-polyprenyl-1,4-benzoquinol methylase UbiE [Microbaculum marinum]|uniref:Ubiquinone/menaquinone biosynthesis C-methyltransferase UbiE n=2 Tax=Microbaculum marinum TaxID=1764581 RepID=A0AAW9RK91_9HYPH
MSRDTHFGFQTVPDSEKQGRVDAVFDRVARRYDLMNDLMSGGLHRIWKDAMIAWLSPPRTGAGWSVLDVAGGTGDIAFRIAEAAPASEVTVLDINPNMLDVGQARARKRGLADRLTFVEGNAEDTGLPDGAFDAYTIAFGIRNVTHIDAALEEAYRVLKPGGRFMCLEFSQVEMPLLDRIYDLYSFNAIPAMGRIVAGDAESYRYLVESIRRFPDRETFADMIRDAGFSRVQWRALSGGIAVLHSGWRT